MAKNAFERTVAYIRHDMFEQFMRLLTDTAETWRYHREYYRDKSYWGLYVARDFILKFNPLSIMLSATVYALYYSLRYMRHPIALLMENGRKWVLVLGVVAIAPNILPVSLLYVPYKDFGNALGFGNFFPYEMAIATVVACVIVLAAVSFYIAKKYAQSYTIEKSESESNMMSTYTPLLFDKIASLSKENKPLPEPLPALDNPAKQFSAGKYCIYAPHFAHYNNDKFTEYSKSDYASRVLRHLAATRHRVKSAIEHADMATLLKLFGSGVDVGNTNTMTRAEAWLNDVSKPALQAVYEKIKENERANDYSKDVAEPDPAIIDNLTKCFNENTPEALCYSAYLDLRGKDGTLNKVNETLDKEIKPMFGPFTKNKK